MSLRIIKPGTSRAVGIRPFVLGDNPEETIPSFEEPICPEIAPVPVPAQPAAATAPCVDVALIEKTAFENGYVQGEKAGTQKAEQRVQAVMKRYADSILEIGGLRSSLYAQVEREVVRLAVEVAKKIVHREVNIDRDILRTLVHVALSHVSEKSAVTLHLNPVDYGYLLEERAELMQNEGRDISLLADKSIERGGCIIQTECGDIDARIEEKFREVEHSFFEGGK